jgi:hypothetical protein
VHVTSKAIKPILASVDHAILEMSNRREQVELL